MTATTAQGSPHIRLSLRWKIMLPFLLLAVVMGAGSYVIVNRLFSQTESERFLRQLADSAQQGLDAVVRQQADLLQVERLIANTEGIPAALAQGNAEDLRLRVLPVAVNANVDMVSILDLSGTSMLTVRRQPEGSSGEFEALRGEAFYAEWPFVAQTLQGTSPETSSSKQAGLESIQVNDRNLPVFFVAGPLVDTAGRRYGAVLVGIYLQDMVDQLRKVSAANISVYDNQGQLLASTLEPENPAQLNLAPALLEQSAQLGGVNSPLRQVTIAGNSYQEVMAPLTAGAEGEVLGRLGVSLIQVRMQEGLPQNIRTVILAMALVLLLLVIAGLLIANSVSRPIMSLAEATWRVSEGDLATPLPGSAAGDEIGLLSTAFGHLVDELRRGTLPAGAAMAGGGPTLPSGFGERLPPESQAGMATILFADFRGLADLMRRGAPSDVLTSLSECLTAVVPAVLDHGGSVIKAEGNSLLAIFGLIPRPLPAAVGALQAAHAALEMIEAVQSMNRSRYDRGMPEIGVGVGAASGRVVAGIVRDGSRQHYAVVGEAVDAAVHIESITEGGGSAGLVVSEVTYRLLQPASRQFRFGRHGTAGLPGEGGKVGVYEVEGRREKLLQRGKSPAEYPTEEISA
jgi:class 3 adenylate cyclase/HAMP domain-containing protein